MESPLAENLTTHAQPPCCHPSSTSPAPLPAFSCLLHPVKGIPLRDLLPWLRAFHFEQTSGRGATSRGQQRPRGVASRGGTLRPPSGAVPEVLLHSRPLQARVRDVEVASWASALLGRAPPKEPGAGGFRRPSLRAIPAEPRLGEGRRRAGQAGWVSGSPRPFPP